MESAELAGQAAARGDTVQAIVRGHLTQAVAEGIESTGEVAVLQMEAVTEPTGVRADRLPVIPVDPVEKDNSPPVDFADEKNLIKHIRPNHWIAVDIGAVRFIRLNWVVTLLASIVLWAFVIAVLTAGDTKPPKDSTPEEFEAFVGENLALKEFNKWQSWISQNFSWFYISTQDVWIIFMFYLGYTKYGDIKLGKKHEKPEFKDLIWFSMLFSCGGGIGLYVFGVSEPMYYYRSPAWMGPMGLVTPGYQNDDQLAQQAIFITFYHWGIHAWVVYVLVAVLLGVVCFRWDMPLTLRAAFFPLIGDVIYGPLGDVIDALSMAATTFGVCTSLGLGVNSILIGMMHMDPKIGDTGAKEQENYKVGIIWVITLIATLSVCTGLKNGLKVLSQITFSLGCLLLVLLLYIDNTWFLLNVFVQSVGHYFQYLIQISFETDAWQQLNYEFYNWGDNLLADSGTHRLWTQLTTALGTDGLADPAEFYGSSMNSFLHWWTIFYWGWWIAWAPFVGMFMARISRGRTIRQVLLGALLAPMLYGFFFLGTLGALGIKMQRSVELALDVPPLAGGHPDCTGLGYEDGKAVGAGAIALEKIGYRALACRGFDTPIFDVVEPYGERMGEFMKVLILSGLTLYFITSSDSGSYVDDTLSAGGMLHPPIIQRVYWAITEGACACALLVGGKDQALRGLRAVSICSGFPYTIVLCLMCTALWRAVKWDCMEDAIHRMTRFNTVLFGWTEGFTPRCGGPSVVERIISLALSFFAPWLSMHEVHIKLFGNYGWFHTIGQAAFFLCWIGLLIGETGTQYASYVGWMMFTVFCSWITAIRIKARYAWDIYGFALEDFFATYVMWPFVASQMQLQARHVPLVFDPNPVDDRFTNYPVELPHKSRDLDVMPPAQSEQSASAANAQPMTFVQPAVWEQTAQPQYGSYPLAQNPMYGGMHMWTAQA